MDNQETQATLDKQ